MKSEGPRCCSTTKSWLLGRMVLELTKVTPHMSGIVLVHDPDIINTSQTYISTHLPSLLAFLSREWLRWQGNVGGGGLRRVFVYGLSL